MTTCANNCGPAAHKAEGEVFCAKCVHCEFGDCEECEDEAYERRIQADDARAEDDAFDNVCGWKRGTTAAFDEDAAAEHGGRQ